MAVSPIFIVRLKRMIERLRDPYPLDQVEQRQLSEILTFDDKLEVERRRQEIYHFNDLMLACVFNELPLPEDIPAIGDYNTNMPVMVREGLSVTRRIEKRYEKLDRIAAAGYNNPNLLASERAALERDIKLLENAYVAHVFSVYDRFPPEAKRWVIHEGPRHLDNLPRAVESWENAYWPNHPNANRQAHIEVLEIKLARLIAR